MLPGGFVDRLRRLRAEQAQCASLPFADALSAESIQAVVTELKLSFRERVFSPLVTLWVFLRQTLDPDQSCRQALCVLLAHRVSQNLSKCSLRSGSYCDARRRLPLALFQKLAQRTGRELQAKAADDWLFHQRRIVLVDGTTVSMPDTPQNAARFDKPRNQHGAGPFPVARLLVVLCGATAVVLDAAIGACRGTGTGELTLFRSLTHAFFPGDIVLADRLFCTYGDVAWLKSQGVDVVMRLSPKRRADFRSGRRLGHHDHLATWLKPRKRSVPGLTDDAYSALPDELVVRELRVTVKLPGFRTRTLELATTLLDAVQFPRTEIEELFRQRWQVEVNLRSIKSVLHMDVLRCHTPEMVEKEIWTHLLAYSLLCSLINDAARRRNRRVSTFSFKAASQLLNSFRDKLAGASSMAKLKLLAEIMLDSIAEFKVQNRPDRHEPRKIKRPPKPYPRLKHPRNSRKACVPQSKAR